MSRLDLLQRVLRKDLVSSILRRIIWGSKFVLSPCVSLKRVIGSCWLPNPLSTSHLSSIDAGSSLTYDIE